MTKKILAIVLAALLIASLAACTETGNGEETTSDNIIDIGGTGSETSDEGETGETVETTDGKTPGELEYTAETGKVCILHINIAANLRNADFTVFDSFRNGTEFDKIAVSTDGKWVKVLYEGKEYYIASKCVVDKAHLDGFTDLDKTLTIATGSLRVRLVPAMRHEDDVLHYLKENDTVKVVAHNTEIGWYEVEVTVNDKVITGYIADNAEYFKETKDLETSDTCDTTIVEPTETTETSDTCDTTIVEPTETTETTNEAK